VLALVAVGCVDPPFNLHVGGAHDLVGGRWQQPALHLCEVLVLMVVLAEHYGLLVVAATGLWHGGYLVGMNNGGGSMIPLAPRRRSN
jgi:hypothetical protein